MKAVAAGGTASAATSAISAPAISQGKLWALERISPSDVYRFLKETGAEMVKLFGGASPTSTLVGVTRLADPRYLR